MPKDQNLSTRKSQLLPILNGCNILAFKNTAFHIQVYMGSKGLNFGTSALLFLLR